jgi:opacity protein-like surface antigen
MKRIVVAAIAAVSFASAAQAQNLPEAIAAPGEKVMFTIYAEGAQVYDCKAGADGKLSWTFREPIATLIQDGKTVGRHYAGPHWELADGGIVQGKVTGRAPGAAVTDIPLLKLEVAARKGQGALTEATTIQRINTRGGQLEGTCLTAGAYRSVAYSTDYVFLKK